MTTQYATRPEMKEWWVRLIQQVRRSPLDPALLAYVPAQIGWEHGGTPIVGWGLVAAKFSPRRDQADMVPVVSGRIEAGGAVEEGSEGDVLLPLLAGHVDSIRALGSMRAPEERDFDFREEEALLELDRVRRRLGKTPLIDIPELWDFEIDPAPDAEPDEPGLADPARA